MPKNILENNKNITLSIDIMFVNEIPFVTTISRHIKFTTVKVIQKRTKSQLSECIKNVVAIYTQRGFKVQHALLDGESVPLRTDLLNMGIYANFATRNEHLPEIEGQHRVIKEQARACRSTLPFEVLPRLILVEMVNNCALWINMFPAKGGICNVSPRNLMTVIKLDYSKHCRLPFRSYVQVHDEPSPTNSPTERTVGAITLGPTGNLQGGYKFLNLRTGKNITRRNWTHLPMPIEVIERVNKIGVA